MNSNTITEPAFLDITNKINVNSGMINFVKSTITSTNLEAAKGGGAGDTVEDVRQMH